MRKLFVYLGSFAFMLMPAFALAQFGNVDSYIRAFGVFINNTLIPILIAVAFLVFIWGAVKYLIIADDTGERRENGKKLMLYQIM